MKQAASRATGAALMCAATLAYFARPLSCTLALEQFNSFDPVPYRNFDRHGFGAMLAWETALLFAIPILWLAFRLFINGQAELRIFGSARSAGATVVSILIALGLGAPTFSQICYLVGLPIGVAMPVAVSSILWLLVVEIGRTAAVKADRLDKAGAWIAAIIALLMTVETLLMLGPLLRQS